MPKTEKIRSFLHFHSLSIISLSLLTLWIVLYSVSNPNSHWGSFFGNAIADWSGSVVIIIGTKFLIEAGSPESRAVHGRRKARVGNLLHRHSLLLFLVITGLGWLLLFARMNPTSKWGQVVGNILSEWLQMAGLVFLTKQLLERGSKESRE